MYDNSSFPVAQAKILEITFDCFLSYTTSNLSENSDGTLFETYSESNHFLLPSLQVPQCEYYHPSSGLW